jgi:hypothetical protein
MTLPPTDTTPPNASAVRTGKKKIAALTPDQIAYQKALNAAIKRYLANPLLKAAGQEIQFTKKQIEEYVKCSEDAVYFVSRWVKIVNVDMGLVKIDLYPRQEEMIRTAQGNRFVIINASRQIGKTTTMAVGYLLWYVLFHADKRVGILANKEATAHEILSRIRIAYQNLPLWMQQGVIEWKKGSLSLENGSSIKASSTSSSAIRGWAVNCLYLDEFAHVPPNIADDFFTSVYPTISSGRTTQVIMTSTPNGMNLFYKFCNEARKQFSQPDKWNGFILREYDWRTVPWRDEDWERRERAMLGDKFDQEHLVEFIGSQGTLISAKSLRTLSYRESVAKMYEDRITVYETPKANTPYLLVADTSYGKELDYSAFIVYDISKAPYRMVATFKHNDVPHELYPDVIKAAAKYFNDAWVFGENNDVGSQVFHILQTDLEYENILFTENSKGKIIMKNTGDMAGLRTSPKVKRQGCMALKSLVETQTLIVDDFQCIEELSSFIAKKNKTYSADEGRFDDLCTCMWIFAWLTSQQYFKDLTNEDVRIRMHSERAAQVEAEMPPLPIVMGPMSAPKANSFVMDGAVWEEASMISNVEAQQLIGFSRYH